MKSKEIRNKSVESLRELLKERRERLRDLRFALSGGKVKNVREIREVKRDIARISTIIKEKENDIKKDVVIKEKNIN
ncbi:MAG: 50S ribosomal protein L29 [Candidatus Pacebacteria bacterium]|nr:50S ribosomal protein L29 [Candidatus Paceibacterota bacterium]